MPMFMLLAMHVYAKRRRALLRDGAAVRARFMQRVPITPGGTDALDAQQQPRSVVDFAQVLSKGAHQLAQQPQRRVRDRNSRERREQHAVKHEARARRAEGKGKLHVERE